MDYLEIDPVTNVAIGGAYQKIPDTDPTEWVNWIEISGNAGVGYTWIPTSESWIAPNVSLETIRIIRDSILLSSDWRVSVSDYPNSDIDAWITYRTLLRDYPATYTPVENPIWPEAPS